MSFIKSRWLNISLWKWLNWTQAHISQPVQACGESCGCCLTGALSVTLQRPAATRTGKAFACLWSAQACEKFFCTSKHYLHCLLLSKAGLLQRRWPLIPTCSLLHPPSVCLSGLPGWPQAGKLSSAAPSPFCSRAHSKGRDEGRGCRPRPASSRIRSREGSRHWSKENPGGGSRRTGTSWPKGMGLQQGDSMRTATG